MLENMNKMLIPELLDSIRLIIVNARKRVFQTINNDLIVTYWAIGKEIVEKKRV